MKIVIESSWKVQGLDFLRQMWQGRNLPGDIYDVTPDIYDEDLLTVDLSDPQVFSNLECMGKGREISAWLREHGGRDCSYVILDDAAGFLGELVSHHIPIQPYSGITHEDADKAIKALSFSWEKP